MRKKAYSPKRIRRIVGAIDPQQGLAEGWLVAVNVGDLERQESRLIKAVGIIHDVNNLIDDADASERLKKEAYEYLHR